MPYDEDKVDEAVLALLSLTTFQDAGGTRAWKAHAWEVLDRLHEKGLIGDPRSKAKSVLLTDEGAEKSEQLFRDRFSSTP